MGGPVVSSHSTASSTETNQMTIKTTTDKAAVVDTEYHWIDASKHPPPRGSKLLCINKHYGVAVFSVWVPAFGFTHWSPVPTFPKEDNAS